MEFKDYYKILGVQADAGKDEIKSAYRKLARKYHPDMNPSQDAAEKFKEVAEAYEVLKDPRRRAKFDDLRKYGQQSSAGFEPPPGWQRAGPSSYQGETPFADDFSDFFNAIFGGRADESFYAEHMRQRHSKGQDAEIEIPVFLEETLSKHIKTVEYQIPVYGGLRHARKQLRVKIPAGVMDGERIRVKGQGAPSSNGGENGDLYLHIRLVAHPLFDVQGHDLILTLPVSPWEAALGTKIKAPTLEGDINLTITANTQTGKKLRIKGKGLQGKNAVGDLYAIIKVVMPTASNENSKRLWRELSQSIFFDPRAEWGKRK